MDEGGGEAMVFLNRLGLVVVLAGALIFGLRDGAEEAVKGHPESLWHDGVGRVDAMISEDTQDQVSNGITDSMEFAEGVGSDVQGFAE
jgi:hypothetical protein